MDADWLIRFNAAPLIACVALIYHQFSYVAPLSTRRLSLDYPRCDVSWRCAGEGVDLTAFLVRRYFGNARSGVVPGAGYLGSGRGCWILAGLLFDGGETIIRLFSIAMGCLR